MSERRSKDASFSGFATDARLQSRTVAIDGFNRNGIFFGRTHLDERVGHAIVRLETTTVEVSHHDWDLAAN